MGAVHSRCRRPSVSALLRSEPGRAYHLIFLKFPSVVRGPRRGLYRSQLSLRIKTHTQPRNASSHTRNAQFCAKSFETHQATIFPDNPQHISSICQTCDRHPLPVQLFPRFGCQSHLDALRTLAALYDSRSDCQNHSTKSCLLICLT